MHHICTICESPFLLDSDSATVDTETVVTTCGHIFHRGCFEVQAGSAAATCPACSAPCREKDKLIKLFISYDEDDYDRNLLKDVLSVSATSSELKQLEEQSNLVSLNRRNEFLQEEHQFNQLQVNNWCRHVKEVEARSQAYEKRLKRIQDRLDEMEAECKKLEEQYRNV
ncbi:uncharacterized protein TRAVEDRAFT_22743 [Trametes versicolor FP-101664 SS1]|uniref:uncharacterized protein n=1 Tax=Trametes versicolor (strain FP-101664) TaxID=717944 RepID=UPI000462148C|nr:uncharacterized protein TRAVEDRAFT_22743 [Trametes versicolor FP-101664 SS1]EIW54891.1 hypothetical protein TRAVEDRAFT_22743 [Trametes versicolor FP-101664 SS1]